MKNTKFSSKTIVCITLVLLLIFSSVFMTTVFAEDEISNTGATTYYLWGQNNNGPDFSSMKTPTATFAYDASLGYYCDIPSSSFASGDYCFVISTNSTNGGQAANSQAIKSAGTSGSYYLQYGNYSSYTCFHIWNDKKDSVRLSFTSTTGGLTCNKAGQVPTTSPTTKPTTQPTTPPSPTTKPTFPTTPTTTPTTPTGQIMVYCKNTANWPSVNVYMWTGSTDVNAAWPGKPMTNIGDNIWQYIVPKNYASIIFNSGSNQTADLTFPGNGYIYDNATKEWSIYDISPVQVKSFTTDLVSPQYTGVEITLSAQASGIGAMNYRFSAINNSDGTSQLLREYSTISTAKWTPAVVGSYTLKFEFKDSMNNTNSRTMSYIVEDDSHITSPIIKMVTPNSGYLIKNQKTNITVSASGGNTGTKLLFYKYEIQDKNENIVNVPYYTLSNKYSYTPTSVGKYYLTVSVQGSDNTTVTRTYSLDCVSEAPTVGLRGDANENNKVDISDVTVIQQYKASLITSSGLNLDNADANLDGTVTIVDATVIQQYLAGLITW